MKKGIVAGLIVLCVALGAGTAAVVVTDDRKGPEIELPADGDVTYKAVIQRLCWKALLQRMRKTEM